MSDKSWVIPFLIKSKHSDNAKFQSKYLYEIEKFMPTKLFKYYTFEDEYSLLNLVNDVIHFSKPNTFNDPFDCNFTYDINADIKRQRLDANETYMAFEKNKAKAQILVNESTLISCFSEESDNILMWSHYANKHTGFCVEYDVSKISDIYKFNLLPILYCNKRPKITDIIEKGKNNVAALYASLLSKSEIWNYEKEWRLILLRNSINDDNITQDIVKSVYCGINTSIDNINEIHAIINKKNKLRDNDNLININFYELDEYTYSIKFKQN